MYKTMKEKKYSKKSHPSRKASFAVHPGKYHSAPRRKVSVGKYTGTPDSETIAQYIDRLQYQPEKSEEVLSRFAHIVRP